MELLKLAGVLFVVVGFILKWDTFSTVVAAGIITGLVAVMNGDMTFIGIFETLGKSFVNQRVATIFALSVGIIGICERYGLKEKAKDLIMKLKGVTCGRLLSVWLTVRQFSAAFSLRLGGHVQFIRPLILPMCEGAVAAKYEKVDEKDADMVKGLAAASENFGNFFGQLCFMGSSGTLLIASTLTEQGYDVSPLQIAAASWPIFAVSLILAIVYFLIFDTKMKKKYSKKA